MENTDNINEIKNKILDGARTEFFQNGFIRITIACADPERRSKSQKRLCFLRLMTRRS